jgi:hypothetical protein
MEYFRLDHPPDRLILCNRSNCEGIADYLEVNEHGGEYLACAAHTSSKKVCLGSAERCTEFRRVPEPACGLTLLRIDMPRLYSHGESVAEYVRRRFWRFPCFPFGLTSDGLFSGATLLRSRS